MSRRYPCLPVHSPSRSHGWIAGTGSLYGFLGWPGGLLRKKTSPRGDSTVSQLHLRTKQDERWLVRLTTSSIYKCIYIYIFIYIYRSFSPKSKGCSRKLYRNSDWCRPGCNMSRHSILVFTPQEHRDCCSLLNIRHTYIYIYILYKYIYPWFLDPFSALFKSTGESINSNVPTSKRISWLAITPRYTYLFMIIYLYFIYTW